jgi:hypothetical protein
MAFARGETLKVEKLKRQRVDVAAFANVTACQGAVPSQRFSLFNYNLIKCGAQVIEDVARQ